MALLQEPNDFFLNHAGALSRHDSGRFNSSLRGLEKESVQCRVHIGLSETVQVQTRALASTGIFRLFWR